MSEIHTLEKELATYASRRAEFANEEGRYVVIAGEQVIGIYDTYQDALSSGYKSVKLEPFLVKQISSIEGVANFSRHLKVA